MWNTVTNVTHARWLRHVLPSLLAAAMLCGTVGASVLVASPAQAAPRQLTPRPAIVLSGQTTHATPGIAVVGSTIYIAYTGDDSATCARACHNLYVTYSTDGGNTWLGPTELTDTAQAGTGPAVCEFNNRPYIMWAGSDSGGYLYVGYYVNGQNTLNNHTTVTGQTTTHTPTCTEADTVLEGV